MSDQLHPSVKEFKTFINKHPKLIEEVRKKGKSWQEYYEKWALLGEDDPFWDQFKEASTGNKNERTTKKKQNELLEKLTSLTENVDLNKIQHQAEQLNKTIGTIQEALGNFQETKRKFPSARNPQQQNHFNWFHD
ncbi:YlbD family protein [Oceanobacillus halotolerans]|uniref:YlbD family protein n=1 Tax=Oceanobacillus halotolerans TaxID=2663380 RepID=UPI001CF79B13|nr:YlbD family protein [Oceanobacillus halotolerans]